MIGLLLSLLLALQSPVALFFMFVFGNFHIWDFWNIIICRIRWSGAPQTHMPCWLLASSEASQIRLCSRILGRRHHLFMAQSVIISQIKKSMSHTDEAQFLSNNYLFPQLIMWCGSCHSPLLLQLALRTEASHQSIAVIGDLSHEPIRA
jgi:hypothetical protein